MRASLLASAMASRLRWGRRLEAFSIHGHKARIAAAGRRSMTTWAACTKRVRRYLLPRLEILPSLVRSPVDSCLRTTEPGGEVASLLEAAAGTDRSHDGTRDNRADTRHGHEAVAGGIVFGEALDLG